jgi:uncharacterized membrane protein YdbT with pleckstrin-like domain
MIMEEKPIWTGTPSHWLNVWWYLGCLLVIFIPFAIARWFKTKFTRYTVTTQRIIVTTGVFTRRTQELELYRVKDYSVVLPFFLRLVHRGTLVLTTSDKSTPNVVLLAVPSVEQLRDDIRRSVEALRDSKRVREVDYDALGDADGNAHT